VNFPRLSGDFIERLLPLRDFCAARTLSISEKKKKKKKFGWLQLVDFKEPTVLELECYLDLCLFIDTFW